MSADTYVRARIDTDTKERAADALEAMGLSISDAIRLLMLRVADERREYSERRQCRVQSGRGLARDPTAGR